MARCYLNDIQEFQFCFSGNDYVDLDSAVRTMTQTMTQVVLEDTGVANPKVTVTCTIVNPTTDFVANEKVSILDFLDLSQKIKDRFVGNCLLHSKGRKEFFKFHITNF